MFNAAFARKHIDAIYRAGLDTEIAARTFVSNNRMHEFGGTQDGVNWTGLNALGAPNAFVLPDVSDVRFFLLTVFRIEGLRLDIQ
jgi:hypothetical protein